MFAWPAPILVLLLLLQPICHTAGLHTCIEWVLTGRAPTRSQDLSVCRAAAFSATPRRTPPHPATPPQLTGRPSRLLWSLRFEDASLGLSPRRSNNAHGTNGLTLTNVTNLNKLSLGRGSIISLVRWFFRAAEQGKSPLYVGRPAVHVCIAGWPILEIVRRSIASQ